MAVERYGGSKTDVIVKLVLVFFVCLLSFSIGTFVGKKFSDNQHKLAQYEPENSNREVASVHPETEVKPTDALTDDEVAKLAEEFVTEEKGEAHVKEEGHPVVDRNSETGHEMKAEPLKAAERVAHNEAPVQAEHAAAPSRIPSSLPKEMAGSAVGKYTLQVASYPEEAEAQKMAAELKGKGFSAFYVSAKVKDKTSNVQKTWYRVSVGLFATLKEAEAYKSDLLARSKVPAAIVQKIAE